MPILQRRLLLGVLGAFAAIVLVKGVLPALLDARGDFANYYTAARILSKGESIEGAYRDFIWFQKEMDRQGIKHQVGGFIPHPPPTALVFLPLTPFDALTAKRIWTLTNVALVILCVFLLAKLTGLDWIITGIIMLGCGVGLINNLLFGQLYLLLLASTLLALHLEQKGFRLLAGACLGILLPVKYVGGVWLLYFGWKRRWKLVAGAGVTVVLIISLTLWLDGSGSMLAFIRQVLPRHLNGEIQDPFSIRLQSWNSLFRRLFLYDPTLNPAPWIDQPLLFFFGKSFIFWSLAVTAIAGFLKVNLASPTHRRLFRMGLIPLVILLLSPGGATYHFLLLSISVGFFLKVLLDLGRPREGVLLVLLYIIVNLPHYLWLEPIANGWLTPIGYSRLGLLFMLFLWILWIFRGQIKWPRPAVTTGLFVLPAVLFAGIAGYSRHVADSGDGAQWLQVSGPEFDRNLGLLLDNPDLGGHSLVFAYCELLDNHYAIYGSDGSRWTGRSQFNYYGPDLFQDDASLLVETIRQGRNEIWLAGSRRDQLSFVVAGESPSWGPQGRRFAFTRNGRIFIKDLRNEDQAVQPLQTSRNCYDVVYSPQGTHLAYCLKTGRGSSLAIYDLQREMERTILTSDTLIAGPNWSSDQKILLFSWEVAGNRDIYALEPGNPREPVRLTSHPARDSEPIWDRHGSRIIFTSDRGRGLEFSTLFWIPVPDGLR